MSEHLISFPSFSAKSNKKSRSLFPSLSSAPLSLKGPVSRPTFVLGWLRRHSCGLVCHSFLLLALVGMQPSDFSSSCIKIVRFFSCPFLELPPKPHSHLSSFLEVIISPFIFKAAGTIGPSVLPPQVRSPEGGTCSGAPKAGRALLPEGTHCRAGKDS